jgi:hypothetical protein
MRVHRALTLMFNTERSATRKLEISPSFHPYGYRRRRLHYSQIVGLSSRTMGLMLFALVGQDGNLRMTREELLALVEGDYTGVSRLRLTQIARAQSLMTHPVSGTEGRGKGSLPSVY